MRRDTRVCNGRLVIEVESQPAERLRRRIRALRGALRAAKLQLAALNQRRRELAAGRTRQGAAGHALLTQRELQVLTLYLREPNDKSVARRLGTQVQTVRNQLASISRKLGVSSRPSLVIKLLSMNRQKKGA